MIQSFKFSKPIPDEIKRKRMSIIKSLIQKGERKTEVFYKALSDAGIPKIYGGELAQLKRRARWEIENSE